MSSPLGEDDHCRSNTLNYDKYPKQLQIASHDIGVGNGNISCGMKDRRDQHASVGVIENPGPDNGRGYGG